MMKGIFKKAIVGLLVVAVLVLAGWKLFFSSNDISTSVNEMKENLTSYHMESSMDIESNDETRSYFVTTDYLLKDNNNYFRVSLLNKNTNQEQIIIRNDKGVFMLTPLLNQVYTFKGDWPLNSPKPYLYQSMLNVFDGNHEIKKMEDGYLISHKPNYENSPSWTKQDMKFSEDLKPLWVNIYDDNSVVVAKVVFTKVDFEPTFSDNFFDVNANMEEARKNLSNSTMATQEDLPLYPSGADVSSILKEETETMVEGKEVHILTYEGDKSFTIIQQIIEPYEEINYVNINGSMVDVAGMVGYVNGYYLSYEYNGVSYNIYSTSLTVSEMVEIASGMEVVAMK